MGGPAFLGISAPWLWIIGGLVLCAAELVAPGTFLIFVGLAAIAVGLVNFAIDLPVFWDLLIGSGLALLFALAGRRFYGGVEERPGQARLNARGQELVGQVFTTEGEMRDGIGHVRVGDSVWRVTGPHVKSGTRVRVTGFASDGVTLLVERAGG